MVVTSPKSRDNIPLIGCNLDTLLDRSYAMKSFHSFRLDSADQCLWRGDERAQITPKAFDVLLQRLEGSFFDGDYPALKVYINNLFHYFNFSVLKP